MGSWLPHLENQRIQRVCSTLLGPLEHESIDAWRRAVLAGVRDLTSMDAAHFAIAPFEGVAKFHVEGFDQSAVREYVNDWHHQDEVYAHLQKRGSGPYTSERYQLVDNFGERRRTSAIWNEWYVPNRYVASAGAVLMTRDLFAQIALISDREDDPRMGEVAFRQFTAIHTAMESGVRSLQLLHGIRTLLGQVLDQIPAPVALFDRRARPLHWNSALREVLASELGQADSKEGELRVLAGRAVSAMRSGRLLGVHPGTAWAGFRIRATWIQRALGLEEAALMLILERPVSEVITEARARQFGLTARQAQVAVRIARGMRTKEIAADLGLRPTTTAHHIERAMNRLGARNRAAVGPALRGDPPPHILRADE